MKSLLSHLSTPFFKYYIAQILVATVSLFSLPILTQIYPADSYGSYLLVVSSVTLISSLLTNWIMQSTLRYLPASADSRLVARQIGGIALFLGLMVAGLSMVLVPYIASLALSNQERLLVALYAGLVCLGGTLSSRELAQEHGNRYAIYLVSIGVLPPLTGITIGLIAGPSLSALLIGQILGLIISLTLLSIPSPRISFKVDKSMVRQFAFYGWPLTMWIVSAQLLNSLDRLMLAKYEGPSVAGIYATTYNLVIAIQSFAFGPLLMAAHPRLMGLWNKNSPHYAVELRQTVNLFFISAGITIGIFFTGFESIGNILLAEEYRPGNYLMPIIAIGHMLFGYTAYVNKSYEFEGQTWKMGLMALIAAIINFLLNLFFLPRFGMEAAAYTTLVSYGAYLILSSIWRPRQHPTPLQVKKILPLFIIPFVIALLHQSLRHFFLLHDTYTLVIVVCLAFFFGILFFQRAWAKHDLPSFIIPGVIEPRDGNTLG